ncbi:MAG: hypothetical protein ACPLW7_00340 [Minisyncoccia bacterium]
MATIKNYIKQYLQWREEQKEKELAEREERVNWYKEKMGSPEKIKNFTEKDLHELIEKLWALKFWRNKAYKVNKLIKDNGLDKLKTAFISLLYAEQSIAKRWDDFRKSIKGLGPSSLSEILTLVFPDQYGIMNMKPLTVLPYLGFLTEKETKNISYGYTSGRDYERFMEALQRVREELKNNGLPEADFIDVDFFIWYLFAHVFELKFKRDKKTVIKSALGIQEISKPEISIAPEEIKEITGHSEAEFILLKLGQILGYDTYSPDRNKNAYGQKLEDLISLEAIPQFTTPALLDTIRNIDVIWFEDEFPVCCFEVEHTTGVTTGLLRLYQTSQLNTKLFVIAPADVLKKFETEMNKMPFRKMKSRYIFRSYEDLIKFYYLAENYSGSKKSFFKEDLL